jgi:hypothetical protein
MEKRRASVRLFSFLFRNYEKIRVSFDFLDLPLGLPTSSISGGNEFGAARHRNREGV